MNTRVYASHVSPWFYNWNTTNKTRVGGVWLLVARCEKLIRESATWIDVWRFIEGSDCQRREGVLCRPANVMFCEVAAADESRYEGERKANMKRTQVDSSPRPGTSAWRQDIKQSRTDVWCVRERASSKIGRGQMISCSCGNSVCLRANKLMLREAVSRLWCTLCLASTKPGLLRGLWCFTADLGGGRGSTTQSVLALSEQSASF